MNIKTPIISTIIIFIIAILLIPLSFANFQTFDEIRTKAEHGNSVAQNELGNAYYNDQGVTQNCCEAVKWFRKAAEQGYAPAQFALGSLYENGNCVLKNNDEAAEWYWKAYEQDFSKAKDKRSLIEKNERIAILIRIKEAQQVKKFLKIHSKQFSLAIKLNHSDISLKNFTSQFETAAISPQNFAKNSDISLENLTISPQNFTENPAISLENLAIPPGNFHSIRTFYATNRIISGSVIPKTFFGTQQGNLVFGSCEVSIPNDHRMGILESPGWTWFFWPETGNPEKHVMLLRVDPKSKTDFFSDLKALINSSEEKQALIFIHGFNTSFEDAARRTAQMVYDLDFKGAPIFFSWPSRGGILPSFKEILDGQITAYKTDENNEAWAVSDLKAFLTEVVSQTKAKRIYLIAHSLGTRALSTALQEIANEPIHTNLFKEIVLAAPDIDADVFQQEIVPIIQPTANRITLYASSNDWALWFSKKIHGGYRAGESEIDKLVIAPGLDTIDVSAVDTSFDGHSYYAENRSVISDIYHLLKNGLPPSQRNLQEKSLNGKKYWAFSP